MLGTSLRLRHLGRYRQLALLALKYARTPAFKGLSSAPGAGPPRDGGGVDARELARDLERLGPTFIKLGQLLSTRSEMLPVRFTEALSRLQDQVEPISYETLAEVVEAELGVRLRKVFPRFDREPLAAASLAQIHRAALRDGREVAVKVQRPGVRRRFIEDLEAVNEVAAFLDRHTEAGRRYEFRRMLSEFSKDLFRELDYEQEALNLRTLRANLREFDRLVIPEPHEDFSTGRVLTMDFVPGRKITALRPLGKLDLEGPALADQLFRAYLRQILVDGFFHGDPHPGNVLLTDDGRLAILDLGMVARLPPGLQEDLLGLLLAVADGRAEDAAAIAMDIGHARRAFDELELRSRVNSLVLSKKDARVARLDLGRIILEITRISGSCGLRLPPELTMVGKALLNLDRVVMALDPGFRPSDVIRAESAKLLQGQLQKSATRTNLYGGILGLKKLTEGLPARVNRILDLVGDNELRLRVDAIDEHLLMSGMQKIANRIAIGAILGSIIIGAALLMRVETRFRLFDFPGLAILLFLAAAAGGVALLVDILYYDESSGPGAPP